MNPNEPNKRMANHISEKRKKNPNEQQGNIKLNLTRSALERLLGDDSELVVQFQHAAAQYYYEKYIKTKVSEKVENGVKGEVERAYHNLKQEIFSELRWNRERIKNEIDKAVKEMVEEQAERLARSKMGKIFNEFSDQYLTTDNLLSLTLEFVRQVIKKECPEIIVKCMIDQEVKDRIKSIADTLQISTQKGE